MMWLPLTIFGVVAMGMLHLIASHFSHTRKDKEKRDEELQDLYDSLNAALENHPDDIPLHCALRDRINRVQEQ